MRAISPALGKALALSLLLHALLFAGHAWLGAPARRAAAVPAVQLDVTLPPHAPQAQAQPPLFLNESPQSHAPATPRVRPAPAPAAPVSQAAQGLHASLAAAPGPVLAGEAARQANAQLARELLYPPEAIARGLEGQVLVLLFLDASGNAIAARVEAGSGHALLDAAALRAARTLRALPDSAPREALLPVRFRLR